MLFDQSRRKRRRGLIEQHQLGPCHLLARESKLLPITAQQGGGALFAAEKNRGQTQFCQPSAIIWSRVLPINFRNRRLVA